MLENLTCEFCTKVCLNANSYRQHKIRCKSNPNKIINFKVSNFNKGKKLTQEKKELIKIKKYGPIIKKERSCLKCKNRYEYEEREKVNKHSKYCSLKCSNSRIHNFETKVKIKKSVIKSYNNTKLLVGTQVKKETKKIRVNIKIILDLKNLKVCSQCSKSFFTKRKPWKFWKNFCSNSCTTTFFWRIGYLTSIVKERIRKGLYVHTGGTCKKIKFTSSNWKVQIIQGSYEYRMCLILEKLKELRYLKEWESTNDFFPYIGLDWKEHFYFIDFKVYDFNWNFYYIETKGYQTLTDILKWNSIKKLWYRLEVYFLKDIQEKEKVLGIENYFLRSWDKNKISYP